MSSPVNPSERGSPQREQYFVSPTLNDFDFLTRKIARLQQDYRQVCDELQKVRNRLRKAQDFQIKYELASKQKLSLQSQMQSKDMLLMQYQTQIKQHQVSSAQTRNIQLNFKIQKDSLVRESQQWRLRFYQAQQLASKIKAELEYKMNQKLMSQLQLLKRHFCSQEQQYKNRIRVLEINLSEKETLEDVLKDKNLKSNLDKDNQIQRLQGNIGKLRQEHLAYAQYKNKELISVADRFQNLFNHEIQKLRLNQANNNQKFSVQVEGLRGLLQLKNQEVSQLIRQGNQSRQNFLSQKSQLMKQISLLREKIYLRERQNELQLYNLKERLIALHKADTQNMKQNFEAINLNLEENNRQLEKLIQKKDQEIFGLNQRFQQKRRQLMQTISQKDAQISQLQQTIRQTGNINAKEMDNLHSSFHKITTERGQLSTEYQSTFNFLNNQISKLTHSNELKNQEIKDLHLQLSQFKKNSSEQVKDLQIKWRQQRKERQQERGRQRELRQKSQDQFRQKQQRWRVRERMLQREKQKQQREKVKQKVSIQQLEKNLQRLTRHVRQNQQRLKHQMQKNQTNFVETGTIRRQLTGQIERQKTELQSIKKMQLDQLHRNHQIQNTRLTNQNQKLLNQLTELKLNFDRLEEDYKRVKNTNKNIDRINKQKMIDYERKMVALNAQINLTQNLYNSFLNAKSRVAKKNKPDTLQN